MPDVAASGLAVRLIQDAPIPLDAELSCAPGELLALVGPSGSGKTTLLRAIAGLYWPQQGIIACGGEIWFDNARGCRLAPQRRRVGLVFQDYALFPHLSALDNVAAALGHLPRRERRARAAQWLAKVHLAGLEGRRPAQLSGGQRQRVALARALARDPAVLLLDEPFSAVDQVTRRKLQRELVLLRRSIRVPMILVTHDLEEATAVADRLCVLYRGRTLQEGPPREVVRHPNSPLIARLMDQRNLFAGIVQEQRPDQGLTRLSWGGRTLEAAYNGDYAVGAPVSWLIPPSHIVMHRRGRPSRGERENPVHGIVSELAVLGETTAVTVGIDGLDGVLNFTVSTHAAERNELAVGVDIGVSLLAEGIHLMPPESPDPGAR